MSVVRLVAKNTGFLLLGRMTTKIISFFILLYIARYLGPTDFGKFSFVFAFIYFFGFITEIGIHDILVREVAKEPENAGKLIGNATIVKVVLSFVALLLAIVAINIMDYPESTKNALYVASLGLVVTCLNAFGIIYEVNLRMEYSVLFSVTSRIFFLLFVLIASLRNSTLIAFVLASVAADFIEYLLMFLFSRKFVKTKFKLEFNIVKRILRESIPVAVASVFTMIYFRIDVVMLSILKGDIDVGFYSASYRLTEAFIFLPSVLITSIFPLMSKYNKNSQALFNNIYIHSLKYLLASGLLMGIMVTFLAERIILLIYGVEYYQSVKVLQILIWATSIMYVNILLGSTYISSGHQGIIAKVSAFAALFNVGLNLLLIPSFTYVGAALATVATEFIVMLFGIYWIEKNILHKSLFNEIFYPLVGALLTFIFFALLKNQLNIILLCSLSVFVFLGVLYLTGWLNSDDKRLLKKLIIRSR